MSEQYNFQNLVGLFRRYVTTGNAELQKSTIKNYISDVRHFLGWHYHETVVSSDPSTISQDSMLRTITTDTYQKYEQYLHSNNTPTSTIKRRTSSMRAFFEYCRSQGYMTQSPLLKLKRIAGLKLTPPTPPTPQRALHPNVILTSGSNNRAQDFRLVLLGFAAALFVFFTLQKSYYSRLLSSNPQFQPQNGTYNTRLLTFRGRLTDRSGDPIMRNSHVRFKLYPSATSTTAVYDSEYCITRPDIHGAIDVAIGGSQKSQRSCGKPIPSGLFLEHDKLYLGVTIETNAEMQPRQQIYSVGLSENANKLAGLTSGTGSNNIPYINKDGTLGLTSPSPSLEAESVSESFKISSSKSLLMESRGDGDVILSATDTGRIRFLTYGSDIDKMVIAQNGNVGVGTLDPAFFKLEVAGSVGPSLSNSYNLGAPDRLWNTVFASRICFDGLGNCLSSVTTDQTVSKSTNDDFFIGGTATASANVKFSSSAGNHSFIRSGYLGLGTTSPQSILDLHGTATFGSNDIDITTHNNEDLTLVANGSGIIQLADTTHVGGSFASGVSVDSGTTTIDIGGNATGYALCHSSESGTNNQQVVDCGSTPTADFAEMYPVARGSDYGQIMTLSSEEVKTTDGQYIRRLVPATTSYDNHVLGVISNNYGDFISVGHNINQADNPMPIALKGRIPVSIASDSEPIHAGDYLTSSTQPGRATRATRSGVMIGQALQNWDSRSGHNQIMVFISTAYVALSDTPPDLNRMIADTITNVYDTITVKSHIYSPVVETDSLITHSVTTDTIAPTDGKNLTIDLSHQASDSATQSKLSIKGIDGREVASVDARGDISTSGRLAAQEASISGTLSAHTVESDNIRELESRLATAVNQTDYQQDLNKINTTLGRLSTTPLPDPHLYQTIDHPIVASESAVALLSQLTVTGDTDLFNLNVYNKINSQNDELRISALSRINFFDGAIMLARDGNITTNGTLIARGGVETSRLKITDGVRDVASIDASGAARFHSIALDTNLDTTTASAIIASERNYLERGVYKPAIETRGNSAGIGIVPQNESEVVVYNDTLKADSLIFLTQTHMSLPSPLSVIEKNTCDQASATASASATPCTKSFTVSAGSAPHEDINFNWLIVNGK